MPVTGIKVYLEIYNLNVKTAKSLINCDWDNMKLIRGNREFMRNIIPCQINYTNEIQISDEDGIAYFKNFTLINSPEGAYSFRYTDKNKASSESFYILMRSVYSELKVLNSPPKFAYINHTLNPQPSFRILDMYGNPAQGIMN